MGCDFKKFLIVAFSLMIGYFINLNATEIEENDVFGLNDLDLLYCEPDLCKIYNGTDYNYLDHIGCGNNGTFNDECKDATMVIMNQRRINLILDLHNSARNRIAMGNLPGYESAINMPVLKWDNELEYLASLNVKRCRFEHDDCRNTEKFQYSGQNIGIVWQSVPIGSNSKRIKHVVGLWFEEYKDANETFIEEFQFHPEGKQIGHFTLMVSDGVQRVGCSAARYRDGQNRFTFLMSCNYDFNSLFGKPIYQSGLTASNCTNRGSSRFPGLCEWDNDYDDSIESSELIDSNFLEIPELL